MKENLHGRADISSEYEDMKQHWYLPKQTTVSYLSTLRWSLQWDAHWLCKERRRRFQFLLPTSPAATGCKPLVATVLPASYVHRVKQTSSKVPFFVFHPPGCVRVWISCWLARPGARGRGRMISACRIACCQVEVSITVHTKIPVELLKRQVILLSTFPLTVGLSPGCGC